MVQSFEIHVTETIQAPVAAVWNALTNPSVVKQYFFGTELVTSWQVGEPIIFQGEWEGKAYQDKGTVLEFVPNRRLAFSYLSSWSGQEDDPANYLRVAYELEGRGEETVLTIRQTNYDEERATHSQQNWLALIEAMRKLVEAP